MLQDYRLKKGLRWKRSYPTPTDYVDQILHVGVLLSVLVILLLVAGRLSAEDAMLEEQMLREAYQKVVLNCMNQAANGGNVGLILDNKAYSVECELLSKNAYAGVKGHGL